VTLKQWWDVASADAKSALLALKPSPRAFTWRTAGIFLISVTIPLLIEYAPHLLEFGPRSHSIWRSPVYLYQWLVTLGPRKPRSHFVRLVVLRRGSAPDEALDETNLCPGRAFTAKLLQAIQRANPAMIVIDKRFAKSTECAGTATQDLVTTLEGVAASIPVVAGYWDRSADEIPNEAADVREKLKHEQALLLFASLTFKGVTQAALQLDYDNRRIPLDWPVYDSLDDVRGARPHLVPSLAVAAAESYDPGALAQPRIRELRKIPDFPFTSFLTEEAIGSFEPLKLVCAEGSEAWRNCPPAAPEPKLRNRIVVIGQDFSYDFHESAIGGVPGVVLQANYIESLLDDRYLRPVPWWVQLVLSILWIAVIELVFDKVRLLWAVLWSTLITAVAGLILYTVCVVQLGIYLVLLPPSILVITLKVLDHWMHPHPE
jgi:Predicted transmembrane sensor domain